MIQWVRYCLIAATLPSFPAMAAFTPANRPIDVQHYKISLEVDPSKDPGDFTAETEIRLKATEELKSFSLDTEQLKIEKISLLKPTKKELEFDAADPKVLKITLPKAVAKGQVLTVNVRYQGKINSAHSGLFKVVDPDEPNRGPLLFTHFEALGARAFFPANDEPYDKATTEMVVTVPPGIEALSNGKRLKDRVLKTRNREGWRQIHWTMDKPHATYLVSLAIGPFSKISTKHDGKDVSVWVGSTKTKGASYVLDITKRSLKFFEDYVGVKYPWPQYATIGLPTFLWGGMENTSSTHMNQERTVLNETNSEFEKKRIVGLAAHELAHQWFGDYVTMKWWEDLWLNEAFASHLGTMATKHIFQNEEAEMDVVLDVWDDYFRQEDGPRSHPIVDKELTAPDDAFDAISYTKGEAVLRMLSFYVGEDKFKKGLKRYLTKHALGNTVYQNFFDAISQASGEDLTTFRDSWLLQRGYPVLSYGGEWDAKTRSYKLRLSQRSNHPQDRSLFFFRVPVVLHRKSTPAYSKPLVIDMNSASVTENISLIAEPEWVSVNTQAVVLAKVTQEKRDEERLAAQALGDPDPISRVWAAYELFQPALAGGSLSSYAEKTLAQVLEKDPSPYARIAVLAAFHRMKSRWLPETLGETVLKLTKAVTAKGYERTVLVVSDPHGWSQWRSELLGTMGRVKHDEVLMLLTTQLGRNTLPLDDLGEAAYAVAALGHEKSADVLKAALKVHESRGYRHRYLIQYAFGAFESPLAAAEIRELSKTCGSDLMGRIGWVVTDNKTLKNSPEWAEFLKDFVLTNERFGDEVKARILRSIEEVKEPHVKAMLEAIASQSSSERMRDIAKKVLSKNFGQVS